MAEAKAEREMNRRMLSRVAPGVFALAVTQAFGQVVADDACPKYGVDIAAFASCNGDRAAHVVSDDRSIAAAKRRHSALHLTAIKAHRLLNDTAERTVLVDVRSGPEVVRTGVPVGVKLHMPYAGPTLLTQWDVELHEWPMIGNPEFAAQLLKELAARGIGPDHMVIFICRSGERSAHSADELADFGYTTATVVDGFEGDLGPEQRRSVNGWKNAGLPWTSSIELAARRGQ